MMKCLLVLPLIMTGCISVKLPVSTEDLLLQSKEEPFGFIAMTVSPNEPKDAPFKSYFQFKIKDKETNKDIILRAEKSDIRANIGENGEYPVLFKVKPGRYTLSELSLKWDQTKYRGRYYEALTETLTLPRTTILEIKENSVLHAGIFKYRYQDKEKNGLIEVTIKTETIYDAPSRKTWAKQAHLLKMYSASYLKETNQQYSFPALNWQDELVSE